MHVHCHYRLQMMVMETQDKPAEEVTLVACFLAEIFTRVTVVSLTGYCVLWSYVHMSLLHLIRACFLNVL